GPGGFTLLHHLTGHYPETGKSLKGLYIEIQYQTLIQHAWATAVEVLGFITESQPKFEKGDDRYRNAMSYASEILARAHEQMKGPHPTPTDRQVLDAFLKLENELGFMQTLRGLHQAKSEISDRKNNILIFSQSGHLTVRS